MKTGVKMENTYAVKRQTQVDGKRRGSQRRGREEEVGSGRRKETCIKHSDDCLDLHLSPSSLTELPQSTKTSPNQVDPGGSSPLQSLRIPR